MDNEMKSLLSTTKMTMEDTLKIYNGKTEEIVMAQGNFRRDVLAKSVFALKEVSENLLKIVEEYEKRDTLQTCKELVEEMKKLKDSIPGMIQASVTSGITEVNSESAVINNEPLQEKHVVLIENENREKFTEAAWNDIVKHNINDKLKEVPIRKSCVTKAGQGYMVFPNKEAQEKAQMALQNEFVVTPSTKQHYKLLPKLKIFDIFYKRGENDLLKDAILQKNYVIKQLYDGGKTLDVIFIDDDAKYAVIKVSPEIREEIMKYGSIYIDMQAHHVRDQWHLIQCFRCQEYGHKQGSHHCKSSGSDTCKYCGESHRSKDCRVKGDRSKYKCSNCLKSNKAQIREGACGHTSTSRNCPVVIRELQALANRTFGIQEKNYLG